MMSSAITPSSFSVVGQDCSLARRSVHPSASPPPRFYKSHKISRRSRKFNVLNCVATPPAETKELLVEEFTGASCTGDRIRHWESSQNTVGELVGRDQKIR
ncbi:hypothetical protein KSP40_PGU012686 [Platanthera guangdongensis]|uniref:Uncharacterized protein n=1 Tax=Platanthera guangdongensis TaxID=2320717 RepID=A0ABR2M5J7_9ASPA